MLWAEGSPPPAGLPSTKSSAASKRPGQDAIDRHVERVARGRRAKEEANTQRSQLQLLRLQGLQEEDLLDPFVVPAMWQRQVARGMLEDFEEVGVDEDLEQLKADWGATFHPRSGREGKKVPQPVGRSATMGFAPWVLSIQDDDDEPVSQRAVEGERAKERLATLDALRSLAGTNTASSLPRTPPQRTTWGRAPTSPVSRAAALSLLESPAWPSHSSRPAPVKVPDLSKSLGESQRHREVAPEDAWMAWERRWAREFQQFEELDRARRMREDAERQAAQAAADAAEAEWRQRMEEVRRRSKPTRTVPPQPSKAEWTGRQHRPRTPPTPPPRAEAGGSKPTASGGSRPQAKPAPAPTAKPPQPVVPERRFASFAEYDKAWHNFEAALSKGGQLAYIDVPWPSSLSSVSGVEVCDDHSEQKKKLRAALVRWHPDKWSPILDKVKESEKAKVMERVKEVTQRILEEKKRFSC